MSTAELKRMVEQATPEEQQFLFVCLSEKLKAHTQRELKDLDRLSADLESGKRGLSMAEFEKRLDQSGSGRGE